MSAEEIRRLEADMLDCFARKGCEDTGWVPPAANINGPKVRRIVQLIQDFARKPFEQLAILDLACGEGVYAIECALRGAEVVALDARTERMSHGIEFAKRLGLNNLRFEQTDVRSLTVESHGLFDVILCLGILYHLDVPDSFHVLQHLHSMCRHLLIVDTHVSSNPSQAAEYGGRTYRGRRVREHADHDPETVRRDRVLMSLDNTFSFHFGRPSLVNLLVDTGFTSVCECHAPPEPYAVKDRLTLAATTGKPVAISSYPWINGRTREDLESVFANTAAVVHTLDGPAQANGGIRRAIKRLLRTTGFEIRRVPPGSTE
jgi:SAM-dependent methyltransferase